MRHIGHAILGLLIAATLVFGCDLLMGCANTDGDEPLPWESCGPNYIVPCLLDDWGESPVMFYQLPGECGATEYLWSDGEDFYLQTVFPFGIGCTEVTIWGYLTDCQHGTVILWVAEGEGFGGDGGHISICDDVLWIQVW